MGILVDEINRLRAENEELRNGVNEEKARLSGAIGDALWALGSFPLGASIGLPPEGEEWPAPDVDKARDILQKALRPDLEI